MKFEYRAEDQILAIRTGVVEAESAAEARSVLEGRSLTVLTLRPVVERRSRPETPADPLQVTPQRRATDRPSAAAPMSVALLEPESGLRAVLHQFDWALVGKALAAVVALGLAVALCLWWALGPRDYTIVVEGQLKVANQKPDEVAALINGVHLSLWLPSQGIIVKPDGGVWKENHRHDWVLLQGVRATYKIDKTPSGHFRLEVQLRLPRRPRRGGIIARGLDIATRHVRGIRLRKRTSYLRGRSGDIILVTRKDKALPRAGNGG